ncbi:MBL fold metallo-hydrolase [uncultured Halovibrio sp.]|uniref:MBL fold metallo-hydrolase n=1 Tax=uncultured Halovibrio sp. TaxID=985049 RepID=UPI0025CD3901|nr:MBL fold metallo-hydrolase [uncultured Halovibrio sp.]
MPQLQPSNAHQLHIGDSVLTTPLDAQMEASFGLVQSIPEEKARRLHAENCRPTPPRITLNAFLLDTGDHRILIDTGIGAFTGEGGVGLMDNLNAIGLDASANDTALITHIHPDHVGGSHVDF